MEKDPHLAREMPATPLNLVCAVGEVQKAIVNQTLWMQVAQDSLESLSSSQGEAKQSLLQGGSSMEQRASFNRDGHVNTFTSGFLPYLHASGIHQTV